MNIVNDCVLKIEDIINHSIKDIREFGVFVNCLSVEWGNVKPFQCKDGTHISSSVWESVMLPVSLIRMCVGVMLKRGKVKSAVVCVAGVNEEVPFYQLASASKGFMQAFVRSIALEYEGKIDFLCVTAASPLRNYEINEKIVNAQLECLGRSVVTDGYWKHRFANYFFHSFFEPYKLNFNKIGGKDLNYENEKKQEKNTKKHKLN